MYAHLGACRACRGFHERAAAFSRTVRIHPAESVPDLSAAILARVRGAAAAPVRVSEWARYGLVVGIVAGMVNPTE